MKAGFKGAAAAIFFIPSFLVLHTQPYLSERHSYGMAVECGTKGLKVIPANIRTSAQVGSFTCPQMCHYVKEHISDIPLDVHTKAAD